MTSEAKGQASSAVFDRNKKDDDVAPRLRGKWRQEDRHRAVGGIASMHMEGHLWRIRIGKRRELACHPLGIAGAAVDTHA